jgi:hypothetical protein
VGEKCPMQMLRWSSNAETVPKIPSCHYMLLMQPSRSKFSSNIIDCIHVIYSLPPGENPITDNNNNNNYYYYYEKFNLQLRLPL